MCSRNSDQWIKTYTYEIIDSKMYVMTEGNRALVIDPCIDEGAVAHLKEQGVDDILILLTHEHYDHMSGIDLFRNAFDSCMVLCSEACNTYMQRPTRNGSKYFKALFIDKDSDRIEEAEQVRPVAYTADELFNEEKRFEWQGHDVFIRETPGHSPGSVCIILDEKLLFTGDTLLKNDPVVTRLPGGNKKTYNERALPFLLSLSGDYEVYPGHGESGLLSEFDIVPC